MSNVTCPGCGAPVTIPGRVYCRPSCRAKAEHAARQQRPSPLTGLSVLDSEWPREADVEQKGTTT